MSNTVQNLAFLSLNGVFSFFISTSDAGTTITVVEQRLVRCGLVLPVRFRGKFLYFSEGPIRCWTVS